MIKLKSGKRLIFGLAAAIFLFALAAVNWRSFISDGAIDIRGAVGFAAVYALAAFALIFDIRLGAAASTASAAAMFVLGPFMCFEMVRTLVGAPVYAGYIYLENLVFYAAVQLIVFAFTQSVFVSLAVELAVSYALHAANQIVLMIRGTPLVPTDLFAIGTAMTITSPDEWHFDINMLTGTAGFVLFAAMAAKFKISWPKKMPFSLSRAAAGAAGLVMAAVLCVHIWNIDYRSFSTSTFDTQATNDLNGIALNFYIGARKMHFEKPTGYSEDVIWNYLSQYEDEQLEMSEEELPNIIVIMNESFADLSFMGRLDTDVDYMPFYNELTDSYPHGRLLVSTLGGGTCNTEFEFLTGLSMMYMPSGSYAYMQNITHSIPSLATYLKEYGYEAVAMHPFYEVCWKRNSVYDFMGFDDFISAEDMTDYDSKYQSSSVWLKGFGDGVEYVRNYISDSFFYDQVIEKFESRGADKIFIFGVTVQNHSGYEYDGDDFTADVHITGYDGDYPRAEQYLSLIKKSDEALRKLISYFEQVDEKTIIVFFGDHQPQIEDELIEQISPNLNEIANNFLTRYQTPYLIWANYELEEPESSSVDFGVTSPNFLSVKMLEYAGVPLSREYQMIRDMQKITPAMNAFGYYDRFLCWNDRSNRYDDSILNVYNFYTYYILTHEI